MREIERDREREISVCMCVCDKEREREFQTWGENKIKYWENGCNLKSC